MKLNTQPIKFTISNEAGAQKEYEYPLMSHGSVLMWMSIRKFDTTVNNLFEFKMSDRYALTVTGNNLINLVLAEG